MKKSVSVAMAAIAAIAISAARANNYESLLAEQLAAKFRQSAVCSPYAFVSLIGLIGDAEPSSDARTRIAGIIGVRGEFSEYFRSKNETFAGDLATNGVKLVVANSLWMKNFHRIHADYIKKAHECYGAAMGPYTSPAAPNAWTAAITDGLLAGDTVKEFTAGPTALAVCAAAWHCPWERQFPVSKDGILRDVRNCRIAKSPGFTTVEIPFRGATHHLRLHLPDADRAPRDIVQAIFASRRSLEERLSPATVDIRFPRIDISSQGAAIELLRKAGVPAECFSGITTPPMPLDHATWRCRAIIDETGGAPIEAPQPETPVTAGAPVVFDCTGPFVFEIVAKDRTLLVFGIFDPKR